MTDRLKLLADFLRTSEGYSETAYLDYPGRVPTIGIGHTGPEVRLGLVWTAQQVLDTFANDMSRFTQVVNERTHNPTPNQWAAMVSLAFNIGVGGFRSSTVLTKHNTRDYAGAANAFALWNKDNGVVVPGLVKRRRLEADLYRGIVLDDLVQMIRNMQMALNTAGIRPALQVDGHWGPRTDEALANFQKSKGLELSGDLDDPTATALGIA